MPPPPRWVRAALGAAGVELLVGVEAAVPHPTLSAAVYQHGGLTAQQADVVAEQIAWDVTGNGAAADANRLARRQARVPTASRYSSSKRARPGVPRSHSSQKRSSAPSSSSSRPLRRAFAWAAMVGP